MMRQKGMMKGTVLFVFILVSAICIIGMSQKDCRAQQAQISFEKNAYYDIYYQVKDRVQYVTNVKIADTAAIGEVVYLEIYSSSTQTDKPGYIAVANIIAIFPTGAAKPVTLP